MSKCVQNLRWCPMKPIKLGHLAHYCLPARKVDFYGGEKKNTWTQFRSVRMFDTTPIRSGSLSLSVSLSLLDVYGLI